MPIKSWKPTSSDWLMGLTLHAQQSEWLDRSGILDRRKADAAKTSGDKRKLEDSVPA